MKALHTPEPWESDGPEVHATKGGRLNGLICHLASESKGEANAERIVACVNALAGLNPEAVADVVEALRAYDAAIKAMYGRGDTLALVPGMHLFDPHVKAFAALAKLTEGN
jgi:hypothetical protein